MIGHVVEIAALARLVEVDRRGHDLIAQRQHREHRLDAAGGRVSIVGVSIDEWDGRRRRTDDERLAFLEPQLQTSAALGAHGVRLPIGQAGAVLERALPLLEELDLVLLMSVNPGFGGQKFIASMLPKIEQLRRWIDDRGLAARTPISRAQWRRRPLQARSRRDSVLV